jgi:hypothetical protein
MKIVKENSRLTDASEEYGYVVEAATTIQLSEPKPAITTPSSRIVRLLLERRLVDASTT